MKRAISITTLVLAAGIFAGFTPFTEVKNVCPSCKTGPRFDTLALLSGAQVACNVVAQNNDYYVIERFGELRMVKKAEVSSLKWQGGQARKLALGDQILLNTGVAFHGAIVEEQKGRFFAIQVGKRRHIVWNALIEKVYRQGSPVPLTK